MPMQPCDHEEADSRMCIHAKDALQKGARRILIRIVDTDVVVIFTSVFQDLAMANTSDTTVSMTSVKFLEERSLEPCHSSMLLRGAIPRPSFLEREKGLPGNRGIPIQCFPFSNGPPISATAGKLIVA